MLMMTQRQLSLNSEEATIACASRQHLLRYARSKSPLKLRFADAEHAEHIELPSGIVAVLMDTLEAIAAGQGVTIIPENAELTAMQAADILNVSLPFLIKLLEEKKIPHSMAGKHHRIRYKDVMEYKVSIDAKREKVLDQLVAEAQKHDMGYNKP